MPARRTWGLWSVITHNGANLLFCFFLGGRYQKRLDPGLMSLCFLPLFEFPWSRRCC